jgi:hypothetical protein
MPDVLRLPALPCASQQHEMHVTSALQLCTCSRVYTDHAAVGCARACSNSPQEHVSSSYKQIGGAADPLLAVLPSSAGARDRRRAPAALTSRANSSLRPNLPAGLTSARYDDWHLTDEERGLLTADVCLHPV